MPSRIQIYLTIVNIMRLQANFWNLQRLFEHIDTEGQQRRKVGLDGLSSVGFI